MWNDEVDGIDVLHNTLRVEMHFSARVQWKNK